MATSILPPRFMSVRDNAYSREANALHDELRQARSAGSSMTLSEQERSLQELFLETRERNWDGYNARPLTIEAYANALAFLAVLPSGIPYPQFSPEPDGEVAFEWQSGPRLVFSVSIGPTPRLAYAGLFGTATLHGAEEFTGALPDAIAVGLRRVLSPLA